MKANTWNSAQKWIGIPEVGYSASTSLLVKETPPCLQVICGFSITQRAAIDKERSLLQTSVFHAKKAKIPRVGLTHFLMCWLGFRTSLSKGQNFELWDNCVCVCVCVCVCALGSSKTKHFLRHMSSLCLLGERPAKMTSRPHNWWDYVHALLPRWPWANSMMPECHPRTGW